MASLLALGLFLVWPTTTLQAPLWEIWVVNESGQPLAGMIVTLTSQNYSAQSDEQSETKQTNSDGYVVFPSKTLTVSRFRRIVASLESASAGAHASFGPHAWVMVSGRGLEGEAVERRLRDRLERRATPHGVENNRKTSSSPIKDHSGLAQLQLIENYLSVSRLIRSNR